eukprot:755135-Hanusia_phi.AAC.14
MDVIQSNQHSAAVHPVILPLDTSGGSQIFVSLAAESFHYNFSTATYVMIGHGGEILKDLPLTSSTFLHLSAYCCLVVLDSTRLALHVCPSDLSPSPHVAHSSSIRRPSPLGSHRVASGPFRHSKEGYGRSVLCFPAAGQLPARRLPSHLRSPGARPAWPGCRTTTGPKLPGPGVMHPRRMR